MESKRINIKLIYKSIINYTNVSNYLLQLLRNTTTKIHQMKIYVTSAEYSIDCK